MLSVLTQCPRIEHLLVKTDIGIYRQSQAKATAFFLERYFNQVLGAHIEPAMRFFRVAARRRPPMAGVR